MKKGKDTEPGSLASNLKSARPTSETTGQILVVVSGKTDHIVVNLNLFENLSELDTTVINPDGGNTKILWLEEVEVLAIHVKRCTNP